VTDGEHREGLTLPILIPVGILALIGLILFGFSRLLLSTSATAATIVAVTVAASILTVATVVAARPRQSNGMLFSLLGAVAGVAMIAGGVAVAVVAPEGGGEGEAPPPALTIAAPPNAAADGFDPTSVTLPPDKPADIEFDNNDPGVQHNIVVFQEDPADNPGAQSIFEGELLTGPASTVYHVGTLDAGTYFFHCEIHPLTMTGTIDVGAGEAPSGGGSGQGSPSGGPSGGPSPSPTAG
jgi:plastocyanin